MKAKLQAGFESFFSKRYATTVQIGGVPVRTFLIIFQNEDIQMADRVLPKPEKFASCPYDGKILEFYRGQFDTVFVLLHPFVRPISVDIERFCPDQWPSKFEIIDGCETVTWKRVLALTGLSSLAQIDVGLRTSIHGLKKEAANEDYADRLIALTEELNIIHPSEGQLPPQLENRIYAAIRALGHEWLWLVTTLELRENFIGLMT